MITAMMVLLVICTIANVLATWNAIKAHGAIEKSIEFFLKERYRRPAISTVEQAQLHFCECGHPLCRTVLDHKDRGLFVVWQDMGSLMRPTVERCPRCSQLLEGMR